MTFPRPYFLIISLVVVAAGCGLDEGGACEFNNVQHGKFYCSETDFDDSCEENHQPPTYRAHFHEDKECSDIGYGIPIGGGTLYKANSDASQPSSSGSFAGEGSTSGGGSTSGDEDLGSYEWSYTCPGPHGSSGSLPIPRGNCEQQYKDYGYAAACNQYEDMPPTCRKLYSCLGQSTDHCG